MEQILKVLMALFMAFMQIISTLMGSIGGDKKLEWTWPIGSESRIEADWEDGKHYGIDIVLAVGGDQHLGAGGSGKLAEWAKRDDLYTSAIDIIVNEGKLEGWESLVKEFALARYGGGKRDSFEIKEIWKTAMQLMGINEE